MLLAGKRFYASALVVLTLLLALAPAAMAANKPIVVTFDAVVSDSEVTLKGSVLGDDGQRVTESGFYYGVSSAKLSNKVPSDSAYDIQKTLKQLEPSTTYYVQAYAVSSAGEGLGEVVSFKTGEKAASGDSPELNYWTEKLKNEYGIQIYYKTKRSEWNHLLTYKLVQKDADAVMGMKMIYEGLSKYPQGFVDKLKLKYIALAGEITTKEGESATGVALGNTQQTSMLLLATTKESVLHHEIFHTFEYAFGVRFGDWDKANIKPKLYDENLKKSYDLLLPGFITRYAMTMPQEDRADLFMYMMTQNLKEQLVDAAAHDPYLQDKIKRVSSTLEKYLGKMAQGSSWSVTAAAAAKATPKKLGVIETTSATKLYEAPDTQAFSSVRDIPQGTQLDVVQSGARWHKVLLEGQSYYILASSAGFSRSNNAVSSKDYNALEQRLLKNYGISVSLLDTKADYGSFTAGDVRDLKSAMALVTEFDALLQSGATVPSGITNLVVCRTLREGSSPRSAVRDNTILYISQEIELGGQLKKMLDELSRK